VGIGTAQRLDRVAEVAGRKARCSSCDAVQRYNDHLDAYHAELVAWSRKNPDDIEPSVMFDAPWCHRSI
jgi:hypothetical protein